MNVQHHTNESLMTMLHNAINHPNKAKAELTKTQVYAEWKKRNELFCSGSDVEIMPGEGLLSAFRYRVGDGGVTNASKRQQILNHVLDAPVPPLVDRQYTKKWGSPNSRKRKSTLLQTIKRLASGAGKRTSTQASYSRARSHWEADMMYLEGIYAR